MIMRTRALAGPSRSELGRVLTDQLSESERPDALSLWPRECYGTTFILLFDLALDQLDRVNIKKSLRGPFLDRRLLQNIA